MNIEKKNAYDAWLLKRKDERQTGKLMRVPSKYCAVFFQYCLHMSLDYTSIRRSNTETNVIINLLKKTGSLQILINADG